MLPAAEGSNPSRPAILSKRCNRKGSQRFLFLESAPKGQSATKSATNSCFESALIRSSHFRFSIVKKYEAYFKITTR